MTTQRTSLLLIALLATACASAPTPDHAVDGAAGADAVATVADPAEFAAEDTALDAPLYGGVGEIRLDMDAAKTRPVSLDSDRELPGREPIGTQSLAGQNLVLVVGKTTLAGEVVSDDGRTLELKFTTATGVKGVNKIHYRDLSPRTQLQLMAARTTADDADAHLRLGRFAAANGFHDEALHHFLRAGSIDPALTDTVEADLDALRDDLAASQLEEARALLADGHFDDAQIMFAGIQRDFTGTQAAADAATELSGLAGHAAEAREIADMRTEARIRKALEPASKLLDEAEDASFSGLEAGGNSSQAISRFKKAHSRASKASKKLDQIMKRARDDSELIDAADRLGGAIDDQMRDNQNHLASTYLAKRDYNRALAAASLALEIDPDDERAKDLQQRIEDAITERDKAYYENRYGNGYGYPGWVHGGWYGGWVRPGWRRRGTGWGYRGGGGRRVGTYRRSPIGR